MNWISVEDRLPEDGRHLVYWTTDDGEWSGQSVADFLLCWIVQDDLNVTHWMPLPEPPKGEK